MREMFGDLKIVLTSRSSTVLSSAHCGQIESELWLYCGYDYGQIVAKLRLGLRPNIVNILARLGLASVYIVAYFITSIVARLDLYCKWGLDQDWILAEPN